MSTPLVFAADTLVRFKAGRILIHTTASNLPAFESENASLIGWLCHFAKPTTLEAAVSHLPASDRKTAVEVLDYLRRSGALVESNTAAASPPDDTEAGLNIKSHLRTLARSFYEMACDLMGFGPYADRELTRVTKVGVERRLIALLAATDGFRTELANLRRGYVGAQLATFGAKQDLQAVKLHIGCGKGLLDGWINIDVFPAPLAMNVLWGLPFADGSARFIFISHFLEHLFFPRDVRPFLQEIRRVLAPGGVVRFVVPDIAQCIDAYVNHDKDFFGSRREAWPWWPENPTRLEDFLAYAGAGAEPAYLFESHKYGYDFETLASVLNDAGLTAVENSSYMQSAHDELRVDHISAVANAKYRDRYYSLFVEARRPEG